MSESHILLHALVRGVDLTGMVLLMGGLAFRKLVESSLSHRTLVIELFLPLFLLLIGLADLLLRSHMISGQPLASLWPMLPAVLAKTHFGTVWIVRTLLLIVIFATCVMTRERNSGGKWFEFPAGGGLLLTASLSGHAADAGVFSLAVLIDWLHLLAASAWIGGLFFLALTLRRHFVSRQPKLATQSGSIDTAKNFSRLASICVVLILATGSYQTWDKVGSLPALVDTPYGQTLAVKLLLVLPLLGLGAINRYRFLPRLSKTILDLALGPSALLKKVLTNVKFEIALGFVILLCAGLIVQLPPARSERSSAFKVSTHGTRHVQKGETHPSPVPPAEGASVKILAPKQGQTFKGDQVAIQFKLVKGKRGHHVHAYVDNELMGMFETERGTLNGIKPGIHVLRLRVVADDHQTEMDASDEVKFLVK